MSKRLEDLFGTLRKAAAVQMLGNLSDRALVERFVNAREEAAFTVLIERHGPMVYNVCHRALANRHDAEDACQATFLILARKVASLQKKESLGSWLHCIAGRVASNLKRHAARRRKYEQQLASVVTTEPSGVASPFDALSVIDEELRRLPEEYRTPLILCYLECLPRERAAEALGLTAGSLHGRLERGRGLLRQRLTRRGFSLGLLTSAGVANNGSATVLPATFVVASARAAALVVTGQSASSLIASRVLLLTREVIKNMLLTKLQLGSLAVVGTAIIALIGGGFVSRGEAQDTIAEPTDVKNQLITNADEVFIRRVSKDIRGIEASPAEVHFFVTSPQQDKRQKLLELFSQQQKLTAKQTQQARAKWLVPTNAEAITRQQNETEQSARTRRLEKEIDAQLAKREEEARIALKDVLARPLDLTRMREAMEGDPKPKAARGGEEAEEKRKMEQMLADRDSQRAKEQMLSDKRKEEEANRMRLLEEETKRKEQARMLADGSEEKLREIESKLLDLRYQRELLQRKKETSKNVPEKELQIIELLKRVDLEISTLERKLNVAEREWQAHIETSLGTKPTRNKARQEEIEFDQARKLYSPNPELIKIIDELRGQQAEIRAAYNAELDKLRRQQQFDQDRLNNLLRKFQEAEKTPGKAEPPFPPADGPEPKKPHPPTEKPKGPYPASVPEPQGPYPPPPIKDPDNPKTPASAQDLPGQDIRLEKNPSRVEKGDSLPLPKPAGDPPTGMPPQGGRNPPGTSGAGPIAPGS